MRWDLKKISYFLNLLFAGIIVYLLFSHSSKMVNHTITNDTTIVKMDTVFTTDTLSVSNTIPTPVYINVPQYVKDTLECDILRNKYDSLLQKYNSTVYYNDTLLNDTTGFFNLRERISENSICDRQYFFVRRNKQVTKVLSVDKTYKKALYLGLENSFNNTLKIEADYKLNNFLIGIGYAPSINNNKSVVSCEIKYRLWKK